MRALLVLPTVTIAGCLNIQPPPPSISDASEDRVLIYSAVRNDPASEAEATRACGIHGRRAELVESHRTGLGNEVRYLFACVGE